MPPAVETLILRIAIPSTASLKNQNCPIPGSPSMRIFNQGWDDIVLSRITALSGKQTDAGIWRLVSGQCRQCASTPFPADHCSNQCALSPILPPCGIVVLLHFAEQPLSFCSLMPWGIIKFLRPEAVPSYLQSWFLP